MRGEERVDVVQVLKPGRVLVDHGPVTMTIQAAAAGAPLTPAAVAAGERALALLDELVRYLPTARRAVGELAAVPPGCPAVLDRMVSAVRLLEESDFTPMAAVAGAIAELALEAAVAAGATRVIVNNGGDIALRVPPGDQLRVGIVSDLSTRLCAHMLPVTTESGIGGIATSGLGGRSLTKGIASAAVAIGRSASIADAAATAIANATNAEHPHIQRCLAEEIDPGTDIRGHMVTLAARDVPDPIQEEALQNGARRARELFQRQVVLGWAIFVGHHSLSYPDGLVTRLAQPTRLET